MSSRSAVFCSIRSVAKRATPLVTLVALACGDGATEPRIPFPMPDLTGTWSVAFSAPGVAPGDVVSAGAYLSATFTGVAEVRIVQSDGKVGGDYVVEGEVVLVDRYQATTVLPLNAAAGQLLNGQISWDIQELCGPTRVWCMNGELLGHGGTTPGSILASVSQIHVRSPTQFDIGAFKFYVDGLVDLTNTYQFDGTGTASRIQ